MDLYDAAAFHLLCQRHGGASPAALEQTGGHLLAFLAYLDTQGTAPSLSALTSPAVAAAVLWLQDRDGSIAGRALLHTLGEWRTLLTREGLFVAPAMAGGRR